MGGCRGGAQDAARLVWQLLAVDYEGGLADVHVELDRHHGAGAEGGAAPLVALGRVDLVRVRVRVKVKVRVRVRVRPLGLEP